MKRRNNSSIAWLIIFLCALFLAIYSLWGYGWHLRKTKEMKEEIERLKNEIQELEKERLESTDSAKIK